ncbi:MAG: amidohydrolase, partial [Candidatus Omnitrophica bacterium]|nr:amidohydrolase [Candidatus Omnitrophota bacterium]
MVIDAHSHYMPPQVAQKTAFFKEHWSDADKQLCLMDEHHVDRALLVYPTSDAHLNMGGWEKLCSVYNFSIADLVKKYPDRFIGAGIIPADAPSAIARELKRVEDLGLKAISLASSYQGIYPDDALFEDVYAFARAKHFPIHVHPQIMDPIGEQRVRDPLLSPVLEYVFDVSMAIGKMMMSGVFLRHPDVNFIFAHYGGVLPIVKERFDSTYAMLRKRDFVKDLGKAPGEYFRNLYFDTSGSKSQASLLAVLEVTDVSH